MTTERSGMSLESVRDALRIFERNGTMNVTCAKVGKWADAIDAHLSRDAVVSDEDVDKASRIFEEKWKEPSIYVPSIRECMRAALSSFAARHATVPDGYVLVPVEPTEAMCDAGAEVEVPSNAYHHSDIAIGHEKAASVYKAMLAQRDGGGK